MLRRFIDFKLEDVALKGWAKFSSLPATHGERIDGGVGTFGYWTSLSRNDRLPNYPFYVEVIRESEINTEAFFAEQENCRKLKQLVLFDADSGFVLTWVDGRPFKERVRQLLERYEKSLNEYYTRYVEGTKAFTEPRPSSKPLLNRSLSAGGRG